MTNKHVEFQNDFDNSNCQLICGCESQFVPQECTHETNGLLYFNLLTSKMYRCAGLEWKEWEWGSTGDGLQYTALLRDSAADQPPAPAADADPPSSQDEDDVTVMTSQAGRGRRKSCRQG